MVFFTPFPVKPYTNPCAEELLSIAAYNAQVRYDQYLDSVRAAVKALLVAKCMDAGEQFTYTYDVQEYHFTLYYYDQAGNLYRTAPPKAVKPLPAGQLATVASSRLSGTVFLPAHADPDSSNYAYVTEYRFNSLNQPVQQRTPDGGLSKFWYDDLGRLVFSQNAKQNPGKEYSYTYFDAQGRITQVGQLENTVTLTQSIAGNETSRLSWLTSATDFEQVTRTYYDSLPGFGIATLTHLRKRVAVMTYEDVDDNNHSTYRSATFYTYDIHGNVKQLWQYNSDMPVAHRTKTLHYYYDLVSGKVNGVAYNPTGRDRYFHKYDYDADNRIRKTYTWEGADWKEIGYHDSTNWQMTDLPLSRLSLWPFDEDAAYEYYKHGPMSRTELGHLKVQGLDYVYTIHGWIKAVNSNTLDEVRDPGNDARVIIPNTHRWVAKDAFGYMLDYYAGDYKSIRSFTATERFDAAKHGSGYGPTYITDLFNGNISAMTTTLTEPGTHTIHPQGTAYQYDQLNRLVRMDAWQNLDLVNSEWQSGSPLTDYHTEYTYDANGNLTTLLRNGASSINTDMDDLTYHYISGTNKLDHVDDAVTAGNYPNDIDDQSAGNYDYDAIGNLIQDNAEGIANIEWTVYGKVKRVTRSSINFGPDLEFTYGPSGQRIMKKVIYDHPGVLNDSTLTTLYVRDGSGNIMTVYREVENATVGNEFYIMEQDLYGSSRLGTREKVVDLNVPIVPDPDIEGVIYVERGYKKYELSNHLGNVLMVISDRREGMNCTMASNTYTYYEADILMATDYYPFGSTMPQREWSSTAYNFGMGGQLKDDEIYGAGNSYSAEYWQYDPRLGRRWNVDLLVYPYHSPYVTFNNNPILYNDPSGLEPSPTNQAKKYAKELKKQGITNYTISSWTGKDGGKYASVNWNTDDGEEAIANTKVFREDKMQTYYRNTRDRYWNEGDWVRALSYQMKLWWGNESDDRERAEQFEPIARLIAEFHPAVGIYNVGNGTLGDGTNIWGESQSGVDILLSGVGFIPIGKLGKFSYGLIGELGNNYKIIHQGNLAKYLTKKGWTADEVIQVIENNNKVLHKTPVDNHITNKQLYRYIHPTTPGKDILMDEDGVIIQLGKEGYNWLLK